MSKTEGFVGLKYNWNPATENYSADMDLNLQQIGAMLALTVLSKTLTAPPASPADASCWIVAPEATGAWAGKDNYVAAWTDGAWLFIAPKTGMKAYNEADGTTQLYSSGAWTQDASTAGGSGGGSIAGVTSIGGESGTITLGAGLSISENELSVTGGGSSGGGGQGGPYRYFRFSFENTYDTSYSALALAQIEGFSTVGGTANIFVNVNSSGASSSFCINPNGVYNGPITGTNASSCLFDDVGANYWGTAANVNLAEVLVDLGASNTANLAQFSLLPRAAPYFIQFPIKIAVFGSNDKNGWSLIGNFLGTLPTAQTAQLFNVPSAP